jgi:hypothetical protein
MTTAGTRATSARSMMAAVLVGTALAASGCWGGGNDRERMEAIAAEIEAELAGHPEVAAVEVIYRDYITHSRNMRANITVPPEVDVAPVIDEAARLIWQSEAVPLSSLSVWIYHPGDQSARQTERWIIIDAQGEDYRQLEQRYGPRPVPG